MQFDFFPARYAGTGAAEQVERSFAGIERQHAKRAYDVLLIVGHPAVDADIGVMHQVLAPRIASAVVPVFTALGTDDAQTILGDVANRVFPGPEAMLRHIADCLPDKCLPTEQVVSRIQSLCGFLLAEQAVESTIQMQTGLLPALQQRLQTHLQQTEHAGREWQRVAHPISAQLLREVAALEELRTRIGGELIRLAQNRIDRTTPACSGMTTLRLGLLSVYLGLTGLLWWWTTLAHTIFFSGCALVGLSGLYAALGNRLIAARVQADLPLAAPDSTSTAKPLETPIRAHPARTDQGPTND